MRLVYSLLLVLVLAAVSDAKPITFIFEGQTSGYSDIFEADFSSFVVTAKGDTLDRIVNNSGQKLYSSLIAKTASVELTGLGTVILDNPFWPDKLQVYGAGIAQSGPYLIAFAPGSHMLAIAPLQNWDWNSSVGPISLTGMTDGWVDWMGSFVYGSFPLTFTAIVTPEPSSICLCIGSIVLLGIRRLG